MNVTESETPGSAVRGIRWWPALLIILVAAAAIVWLRQQAEVPFQTRNLQTLSAGVGTLLLLVLWWVAFSRTRWKARLAGLALVLLALGALSATVRIRGVTGDLVPVVEWRWARRPVPSPEPVASPAPANRARVPSGRPDFPQFLGPDRTAILAGPALSPDWAAHPPQLLWRQPIGAAWSGFAIVGDRALTQEQQGDDERVTCYDLVTGRLVWSHSDAAHYATTLAGEGPRCTPTAVSNRVYTLGAGGILNCLDLETGRRHWTHSLTTDAKTGAPGWGYSGSPLVMNGLVIVSAGGAPDKSLLAYAAEDGRLRWSAGDAPAGYSSPCLATLAGTPQILIFNSRRIAAHEPATGKVLWEHPWGIGQPHVTVPVVVATNQVLFSSGYGVGAELLEVKRSSDDRWQATPVWRSKRMKAKFATLVQRDGFLYGLDDGMLACLDLKDGSQRWKQGRYGHGQGLLVSNLYLLMSEQGDLVLLRPTPEGPNELHRFPVFTRKTWNPIALSGDLVLVRNDREAACLRLSLAGRPGLP